MIFLDLIGLLFQMLTFQRKKSALDACQGNSLHACSRLCRGYQGNLGKEAYKSFTQANIVRTRSPYAHEQTSLSRKTRMHHIYRRREV